MILSPFVGCAAWLFTSFCGHLVATISSSRRSSGLPRSQLLFQEGFLMKVLAFSCSMTRSWRFGRHGHTPSMLRTLKVLGLPRVHMLKLSLREIQMRARSVLALTR